jgi:hypothetical protein
MKSGFLARRYLTDDEPPELAFYCATCGAHAFGATDLPGQGPFFGAVTSCPWGGKRTK